MYFIKFKYNCIGNVDNKLWTTITTDVCINNNNNKKHIMFKHGNIKILFISTNIISQLVYNILKFTKVEHCCITSMVLS